MDYLKNIDYKNCITNFTSSIEKFYGLEPHYTTLKEVDSLLAKRNYRNVVIFLFDGMGNNVIDINTKEGHYLQTHRFLKIHSTYPPTTANCTTAMMTGLNPISTGWLGWSTYYKDTKMCVDNFPNGDSLLKSIIPGNNIAEERMPLDRLGDRIKKASNNEVEYHTFFPFGDKHYYSLSDLEHKIIKLCNDGKRHYIYAYYENPDKAMHAEGIKNDHIKSILNDISKTLKNIERKTRDTILFATADHGHIDVSPIAFYTYYDVLDCLDAKLFSCDARTPMFFVKEDRKDDFVMLFNKYFSDDYILFTKEEALKNNLFGEGEKYPNIDNIMGDYIACATNSHYLLLAPNSNLFKGHHAGITFDEMSIPLIYFEN